jgi:SAM-dependent methyltransferase
LLVQTSYAQRYRLLWQRHWWWRARESFVLSWIERLHQRSACARILDVGCGDGLFFDKLERFGRVDGLEPDAALVNDPRWHSRIRADSLGSDFQGTGDYDLVLLLDVLEHIADESGALRAASSALRPGGYLLMTVPALPWLWSRHDEANAHYRRYGSRGLRGVLTASGFQVEAVRYFYAWTVLPLLLRKWLAPAGRGEGDYEVAIPPAAINAGLTALSRCEHAVGRFVRWPVGTSLLAIARRPGPMPATPDPRASISRGSRLLSGAHRAE